eukprot:scaffold212291_cov29-Tisochrysis_lutea.AAC.2
MGRRSWGRTFRWIGRSRRDRLDLDVNVATTLHPLGRKCATPVWLLVRTPLLQRSVSVASFPDLAQLIQWSAFGVRARRRRVGVRCALAGVCSFHHAHCRQSFVRAAGKP